jgi:hypothetical protein
MTYENPRDPRIDSNDPVARGRPSASLGGWLPLVLAAAVAAAVLAMVYPRLATDRAGDTNNAGPSVQTVAPTPSPSTSQAVPTPNPTTERSTQAPIR